MVAISNRISSAVAGAREQLGDAKVRFECCDTTFVAAAIGPGARRAVQRAQQTAARLEGVLNAFDSDSAVAVLNRTGRVENHHVASVVRRGLAYADRTEGAFDVRHGQFEHELKAYIRDGGEQPSATDRDEATVTVDGNEVRTDQPLDLNGLAKGYVVDHAFDTLDGLGRHGFVSGGGDVANPTGPIGIENPYGAAPAEDDHLKVLDTEWHVATSAGYRRGRGGVDHVYDPRTGDAGARHDLVTVVAARDCTEADALATTLAASPLEDALTLAEAWDGLEALVVHDGIFHETEGFGDHVAD
ncbi:FAD:protein FMN transferase [Halorientalis brevis]|uniref:FAD:protein FMN transferase n=1 Tax=Halorientalis brevis TaxID=1126241 RepID=A0ABD6CAS7_9EURY|nr:FAD:protein FMN transferase [Halorientalis brevis]